MKLWILALMNQYQDQHEVTGFVSFCMQNQFHELPLNQLI